MNDSTMVAWSDECLEDGGLEWRMTRRWRLGVRNVLRMVAWSDECLEDGGLE